MAAAAIPVLAVGIGLQAYSSYQAGQARADQARRNAALLEAAAGDALQRGEYQAWRIALAYGRRESEQVVGFAHGGVDVTSGSAAATIAKTAMMGEMERSIVRNNAFREAWGYRTQAGYQRQAAQDAESASYWDAAGVLIGGAGKIAGMSTPSLGTTPGWSDFGPGGAHEGYT